MIEIDLDTIAKPAPPERGVARAWLRALELTTPIAKAPWRTFPAVIEELAEKFGDAPALISDDESLSFRALHERANRYARWALAQDIRKGDTVCLLMPNRPEYLAIWLGITRAGGAVALLNTNLGGASLAHCIDLVSSRHVIVADALAPALAGAEPHLKSRAKTWAHGADAGALPRIDLAVAQLD